MIIYIILILILIFFYYSNNQTENFTNENHSWSDTWNESDFLTRKNADCNPIKKEWKNYGNIQTWIWTVPESCEAGLPHTRDKDVIAMPDGFPSHRYDNTIEHEKIHIYQRLYPKEWAKFYKDKWHYELFKNPPLHLPINLIKNKRANPDTCNELWCRWRKRWWSIPVYESNLSLSGAPVKWYDEKENKIYDNPPSEWISFFGRNISQLEHPHEISAVLLSGPLNKNNKSKSMTNKSIAMTKLLDCWNWDIKPTYPT